MDKEKLEFCLKEAGAFMISAKIVLNRAKKNDFTFFGCKETGSCRRKSLDLTRALAEMRKP